MDDWSLLEQTFQFKVMLKQMPMLTGNYPRGIDVCAQSPIGSSFFFVDLSIAEVGKSPPALRSCRRVIRMAESVLFVEVGKGGTKVDGALPCFRRQKSSLSVQFPLQMVSET